MTKHLKLFYILLTLFVCLYAKATEYVGTMRLANGYTMENIRATLDEQGNLTLYRVKFARLMPVRVDVVFPMVKIKTEGRQKTLSGNAIVPTVNNKPHSDRTVTKMQGRANQHSLVFQCFIKDKKLYYEGKSK